MLTLEEVHRHARRRAAPVSLTWEGAPGRAGDAVAVANEEGLAKAVVVDAAAARERVGAGGAVVAPLSEAAALDVAGPGVAALLFPDGLRFVGPVGAAGAEARAVAGEFAARLLARLRVEAAVALVGDVSAAVADASVRGRGLNARAYGPRADEALARSEVLLFPSGTLGEAARRLLTASGAVRLLAVVPAVEGVVVLLPEGADPVEGLALASAFSP